jgi:Fe-S cluster assembly ATPase SufC
LEDEVRKIIKEIIHTNVYHTSEVKGIVISHENPESSHGVKVKQWIRIKSSKEQHEGYLNMKEIIWRNEKLEVLKVNKKYHIFKYDP